MRELTTLQIACILALAYHFHGRFYQWLRRYTKWSAVVLRRLEQVVEFSFLVLLLELLIRRWI